MPKSTELGGQVGVLPRDDGGVTIQIVVSPFEAFTVAFDAEGARAHIRDVQVALGDKPRIHIAGAEPVVVGMGTPT